MPPTPFSCVTVATIVYADSSVGRRRAHRQEQAQHPCYQIRMLERSHGEIIIPDVAFVGFHCGSLHS